MYVVTFNYILLLRIVLWHISIGFSLQISLVDMSGRWYGCWYYFTHTNTRTHTYIHTHTHTHIHTYTHTHTHIHIYTYTYIHTYMHTYTHAHTHTNTHTNTHTHTHTHIHIHIHIRIYIYIYIDEWKWIYACILLQFNSIFYLNLQIAIACILISSKYNENEEDVPELNTLEEITQQKIMNETVLNYELWVRWSFILYHLYKFCYVIFLLSWLWICWLNFCVLLSVM